MAAPKGCEAQAIPWANDARTAKKTNRKNPRIKPPVAVAIPCGFEGQQPGERPKVVSILNQCWIRASGRARSRSMSEVEWNDPKLSPAQIVDLVWAERRSRRPKYSLRALARDLGVSHSLLSLIRRGHYRPSSRACAHLGKALGEETVWGKLLLKTAAEWSPADTSLRPRRPRAVEFRPLDLDRFRLLGEWHHLAILDLTALADFQSSPEWVAGKLGLTREQVEEAVERLRRLGLLKSTGGRWQKTHRKIVVATPAGSDHAMRAYHKALLQRALKELDYTDKASFDARDITGSLIPVDPTRLTEAKRRVRRFRKSLLEFLSSGDSRELYSLGVQLIPLTTCPARG